MIARAVGGLLATALLTAGCASAAVDHPAAATVRLPPTAGVFDYQISDPYRPAADVRIVDRDHRAHPVSGRYNICYVNAFQTQPEERAFWVDKHPDLLLRHGSGYVEDPGWPGELLLDTSAAAKRAAIADIVGGWIDGCAKAGFDGVEPDNLDSWTRRGVRGAITRADNLALATLLVARAHAAGLAIAQKNTADIGRAGRALGFDFAVAEECEAYRECDGYTGPYGRHVIEIEYTDNPLSAYHRACRDRGGRISIILRDRDVVPRGRPGYRYQHC